MDTFDVVYSASTAVGKKKESEREARPDSVWWERVDQVPAMAGWSPARLPVLAAPEKIHALKTSHRDVFLTGFRIHPLL